MKRAWQGRAALPSPRLSIIVPALNVESYLAQCIDSILAQPFKDFEVIVIDDGSTDSTVNALHEYLASDRRVHLHSQPHAGLGAARNAGVRMARGELLAFVDSDDWLPADAYTPMVRALNRSGSDFVVGAMRRDKGHVNDRMRDNHAQRRMGVTIEDYPLMLADVFAVNKVFRRDFWKRAVLGFPEGIRYEDQVAVTRAFLAAEAFDVIRESVYVWRLRQDKSSITQRRHEIADLRDRVVSKRMSTDLVHAFGSEVVTRRWHLGVLPLDMVAYFRSVPGCSSEYWQLLRSAILEFWDASGYSFADASLPVQQRLMGWFIAQDRRQDVEDLIRFIDEQHRGLPVQLTGTGVRSLLPGARSADAGIPADLFDLHAEELRWEARLLDVEWRPGALTLVGFALIKNVPLAGHRTSLTVLASMGTEAAVPLLVEDRRDPRVTEWVGRRAHDFDDCAFRATLAYSAMVDNGQMEGWPGTRMWRFEMTRVVEQVTRRGSFTTWSPRAVSPQWRDIGAGLHARLVVRDGHVSLEVSSASSVVRGKAAAGREQPLR